MANIHKSAEEIKFLTEARAAIYRFVEGTKYADFPPYFQVLQPSPEMQAALPPDLQGHDMLILHERQHSGQIDFPLAIKLKPDEFIVNRSWLYTETRTLQVMLTDCLYRKGFTYWSAPTRAMVKTPSSGLCSIRTSAREYPEVLPFNPMPFYRENIASMLFQMNNMKPYQINRNQINRNLSLLHLEIDEALKASARFALDIKPVYRVLAEGVGQTAIQYIHTHREVPKWLAELFVKAQMLYTADKEIIIEG